MKLQLSSHELSQSKVEMLVIGVSEVPKSTAETSSAGPFAEPPSVAAKRGKRAAAKACSEGGDTGVKRFGMPALVALDDALGGLLSRCVDEERFAGKRGQVLKVPTSAAAKASAQEGIQAGWVLLLGLGPVGAPRGDGQAEALRLLVHHAVKQVGSRTSLGVYLPDFQPETVRAAAEGAVLGRYECDAYKSAPPSESSKLGQLTFVSSDKASAAARKALSVGQIIGEAVNLAREWVNAPPNVLNPESFAEWAKKEATAAGLDCKVQGPQFLEKEGMHMFLAVNRASAHEPRLVHLKHNPSKKRSKERVVFVGKGLTFDSGGLCLKPGKSMLDMKCDMAGAAVTLATVIAAARLQVPIEVHAVIGAAENMISANAYRPGDILHSMAGKTVEVINTDAEGRLVLGDVLTWAAKRLKPSVMIDHATLTGACMVALGPVTAGLFSDDEALAEAYQAAAKQAGEKAWRLPLDAALRPDLKSHLADIKHTGGAYGGAITAALFLREFVGDTRWLHMDIAGPAFGDRARGIAPKGGTGFGVRTALQYLETLAGS